MQTETLETDLILTQQAVNELHVDIITATLTAVDKFGKASPTGKLPAKDVARMIELMQEAIGEGLFDDVNKHFDDCHNEQSPGLELYNPRLKGVNYAATQQIRNARPETSSTISPIRTLGHSGELNTNHSC